MPQPSKETITAPEVQELAPHISVATEPSENHPRHNEDATFIDAEEDSAGLFDGMGGGLGGEKASQLAKDVISKDLASVPKGADSKAWETAIRKAMEKAQKKVIELGNDLFFEELKDPFAAVTYKDRPQKEIEEFIEKEGKSPTGTTGDILKMVERPDGGVDLVFGHTGDGRIYVLKKKDGELKQITKDQGGPEELVKAGILTPEEAEIVDQATSKEEILQKLGPDKGPLINKIYKDLRRGVKKAFGLSESDFQTGVEHLEPGDLAIMTSDGIHDNLTKEEIKQEIMKGGTPEEISARLVKAAKKRVSEKTLRSKADDETAVVVEVPKTVEAAEAVEEPTVTPEQATKMESDLKKLREMVKYLRTLLPMAKSMEKGLKPLTSKKRLEEIMSMGGARGVEDTLYTTESEILNMERTLAEHRDDIETMKRTTTELRRIREEREKQLKARDQETMEQIRSRVA
jgi:protein phosphatase